MPAMTWQNWSGRIRCAPRALLAPASEQEIVDAVRAAARARRTLRVAGSGHSFTPLVATDGVVLQLDAWHGIASSDQATWQATIRAGTKIAALGDELRAHVKTKLAPYKAPRWIEFVRELPKTATGKIQRFKLRQR